MLAVRTPRCDGSKGMMCQDAQCSKVPSAPDGRELMGQAAIRSLSKKLLQSRQELLVIHPSVLGLGMQRSRDPSWIWSWADWGAP